MSIFIILVIVGIVILGFGIFLCLIYRKNNNDISVSGGVLALIGGCIVIMFIVASIMQPMQIKTTQIRQIKEREQIVYQIENLTEKTDKIKLNEWILTYNDWVNDVNTSKEIYGWFSWYNNLDMSNHKIINLV